MTLPDSFLGWVMFTMYTVGSFGGLVYIVDQITTPLRERRVDVEDEYDPWDNEAYDDPSLTPAPVRHEAPISARKK